MRRRLSRTRRLLSDPAPVSGRDPLTLFATLKTCKTRLRKLVFWAELTECITRLAEILWINYRWQCTLEKCNSLDRHVRWKYSRLNFVILDPYLNFYIQRRPSIPLPHTKKEDAVCFPIKIVSSNSEVLDRNTLSGSCMEFYNILSISPVANTLVLPETESRRVTLQIPNLQDTAF